MQQHRQPVEAAPARAGAWYRQPVLWLGAAILAASLAGCVWMIVLGARYADPSLENAPSHNVLGMPVHRGAGSGAPGTGHVEPARDPASGTTDAPAGRGP